jgi:chromosome segregation ATPase
LTLTDEPNDAQQGDAEAGTLEEQRITLERQAAVLDEQAELIASLQSRDRLAQGQLRQARVEISELRGALLSAEADLTELRQLEADAHELRQLMERLRGIVDDRDLWLERYETVVNSTSWRATEPVRALMTWLRAQRS